MNIAFQPPTAQNYMVIPSEIPSSELPMSIPRGYQTFRPRPLNRNIARRFKFALSLTSDYVSSWRAGAALRPAWENVERYCVFVGYPSSGHSLFGALLD